jgi:hypothetical protein
MSCKSTISLIYGVNKNHSFKNKTDYVKYVTHKYILDKKNLYLPSCADKEKLISYIIKDKVDYYYASFTGEATKYESSYFYNNDKSCSGRVRNEIVNPTGLKMQDSLFFKVKLLNVDTKSRCFPKKNKDNIVLVFSTNQGRIHQRDMLKIQKEFADTSKFNLILISLDKICF